MENIYSQLIFQNKTLLLSNFKREEIMEDFIIGFPNVLRLEPGDDVVVLEDQVDWLKGNKKDKGRIDLLVSYNKEFLAVVELKRGDLTVDDYNQLNSYFKDMSPHKKAAERVKDKTNGVVLENWYGVLVGAGISQGLKDHLSHTPQNSTISFSVIEISRYRSQGESGYVSHVYANKKSVRNSTMYSLDGGGPVPLKWFVLKVFQLYFQKFPDGTFNSLKEYFGCHGFNVIPSVFKECDPRFLPKENYFIDTDQIFLLPNNKAYLLRNFWYFSEAAPLIKIAKSLGSSVKVV